MTTRTFHRTVGVFVLASTSNVVVVVILLPGIYKKILFFFVHMDRLGNREFGLLYGTRLPPPLHFATLVDPGNEALHVIAVVCYRSNSNNPFSGEKQLSQLYPCNAGITAIASIYKHRWCLVRSQHHVRTCSECCVLSAVTHEIS